jgi:2-keto-4-pentenoate hydratase
MNSISDPRVIAGMTRQLARRRALIGAGEPPLGWKVGLGTPAAQKNLDTDCPMVGYLMRRALLPSGARVSLKGWVKPVAEAEIAVHMARDLAPGADEASLRAAIGALGPAIELADMDPVPSRDNLETVLAGDIFQRHVILGEPDRARAGGRLDGLSVHIARNGTSMAQTSDPQANTGKLIEIVGLVARMAAAFGEQVRAGDVIITGSITPPVMLAPADREFTVGFAGKEAISCKLDW